MSRIDELTEPQRRQLSSHADAWVRAALGATPTDRGRAEAAVRQAYRIAGLSAPQIEWCGSPGTAIAAFRKDRAARGAEVRGQLLAALQGHVLKRISWGIWHEVVAAVRIAVRVQVWNNVGRHVARIIEARSARATGQGIIAQYEIATASQYDYFRTVLGLDMATEQISPLIEVCASAGFMLPCSNVCFLADRAGAAARDGQGRLHAEDGPALSWPDGAEIHAWKGMLVPRSVIMEPGSLDLKEIERLTRNAEVRRAVLDRIGPERYLAAARAQLAGADEAGRLWLKRYPDGAAWAVVEVVNGTPEPDGTRKTYYLRVPPTMRTAREAVAWTYGLRDDQYAGILRT